MRLNGYLFSFVLLSNAIFAQQTLHVLFLGNSYTGVNNLPQVIANVAAGAGDSLVFNSNTPGGYTLEQHSIDLTSMNLIQQGGWDYLVLQEQSQLPSFQDYESGGPAYLAIENEGSNPCGRTMYYMTWGRKNGDASNCAAWPPVCTYEGMDSMLRMRYFEMAILNKQELSPVGKVWNRIRHLYPAIELYQADESHPSEAGTYAAACCFYAALYKSDPTTSTYDFTLPPADAAIIRQVAKEVVYDSLSLYDYTDPSPNALFSYSVTSGNNQLLFRNICSGASSYLWEFGDGDTSTAYQPIHTYLSNGNYHVVLHAIDCDRNQMYEDTMGMNVGFCSFTPVVNPDSLRLCPGVSDTLWTQQFDSYQWIDKDGDSIPGATNQYYLPSLQGFYSVIATYQGCSERSFASFVESYLMNMVVYNIDTTLIPDTACVGDTLNFILYPNRPAPAIYVNHWFKDGSLINFVGDTLVITSTGEYYVAVENLMCPGPSIFQTIPIIIPFVNCNISVDEISLDDITVFPQPVKDNIFIKRQNAIALRYDILDISGRKLAGGILNGKESTIDFSSFISGSYFLKAGNYTYKILKID